jgi:hypothetical protein
MGIMRHFDEEFNSPQINGCCEGKINIPGVGEEDHFKIVKMKIVSSKIFASGFW